MFESSSSVKLTNDVPGTLGWQSHFWACLRDFFSSPIFGVGSCSAVDGLKNILQVIPSAGMLDFVYLIWVVSCKKASLSAWWSS